MFCQHCGAKLQEQARFCCSCGKSIEIEVPAKAPRDAVEAPKQESNVLRYLMGVLFLLAGMLPCFFRTSSLDMRALYMEYDFSIYAISAISSLNSFTSFLSPLFYFTSAVVTVYAGAMLLKKDRAMKQPLMLCIIFHGAAIFYHIMLRLLLAIAPKLALSVVTNEPIVIAAGVEILQSGYDPFAYQGITPALRILLSCTVIGCSILLLILQSKKQTCPQRSSAAAGMLAFALSMAVLSIAANYYSSALAAYFGESMLAAVSTARIIFTEKCSLLCTLALFITIALSVFVEKKNWLVRVIVAGTVSVAGLTMLVMARPLVAEYEASTDIFAWSVRNLRMLVLGGMCILVALVFWLQALLQNRLAKWSQIVFPSIIPVIYVTVALICSSVLAIGHIGIGIIVIAMLLAGAALLFGRWVRE